MPTGGLVAHALSVRGRQSLARAGRWILGHNLRLSLDTVEEHTVRIGWRRHLVQTAQWVQKRERMRIVRPATGAGDASDS